MDKSPKWAAGNAAVPCSLLFLIYINDLPNELSLNPRFLLMTLL